METPTILWQTVLSAIQMRISNESFSTWFQPIEFLGVEETSLKLKVPDKIFEDWILNNYEDELYDSIKEAGLADHIVEFEIAAKPLPPAPIEKVSVRRKRISTAAQTVTQETFEMPVAEAVEKGILGALISFEDGMARAMEAGLTRDHFVLAHHKMLFSAMLSIHLNGGTINQVGLTDYLRTQHKLDEVGGQTALFALMEVAPGLTSLSSLIEQLNVVRYKRKALENAVKLQRMASNGASTTDIEELLDSFERSTTQAQAYAATPGGMILRKASKYGFGTEADKLANFNAKIVSEQIEDDGSLEEQRVFELECDLNGERYLIRVPASKFAAMAWPTAQLGARAIVNPGKEAHARCAIQTLSRNIRRTTVYTHTGWRMIDGVWSYLHSGGAITPTGNRNDVMVRLPDSMRLYHLPEPPTDPKARAETFNSVLLLFNAFKKMLTTPLIGGVFGAVLGSIDYSIYLTGTSGTRKSEATALAQAFFGNGFHRLALPASYADSALGILLKAFRAKDAVLVVDDFAPNGDKRHDDKLHATAETIFRAAGNAAGRATAKIDHSERGAKPPRGMLFSSGEDVPCGGSLQNRLLLVPLETDDIQDAPLTKMQKMARSGKFAESMAVFVQHVATYKTTIERLFAADCLRYRELIAKTNDQHKRQPTTIAHLCAAWRVWVRCGVMEGAFTRKEARNLMRQVQESMTTVLEEQKEQQTTKHPADYFLQLLSSALLSGRCHLATIEGEQPENKASLFGWRDGIRQGELAGWIENGLVYLEPAGAYKAAHSQGLSIGEGLPVKPNTLWKRLDEKSLILVKEKNRYLRARTPRTELPTVVIAENRLFT